MSVRMRNDAPRAGRHARFCAASSLHSELVITGVPAAIASSAIMPKPS